MNHELHISLEMTFSSQANHHSISFPMAPAASAMPWARPWENRFLHGEGRDVAKASWHREETPLTSWGKGSLPRLFTWFLYIPSGWEWDFLNHQQYDVRLV